MAQKNYVLIHQDGHYLSINDGNHWICVMDPIAATVLTETKAMNILQNMIKPKEREGWRICPLSDLPAAPSGAAQAAVEDLPQEEVPSLGSPESVPEPEGEKQPAPQEKKPRKRKAANSASPAEQPPVQAAMAAQEPKKKSTRKKQTPAEGKSGKAVTVSPAKIHVPKKPEKSEGAAPENSAELVNGWVERADSLKRQYEALIQRKKDLAEELRRVSAELCDLEHYIEFTSLNAVKGYRIYRRLRECLIRRRKIKDELMCITIFMKAEPHNILNGNLTRQFSGLQTREYSPRVLQELFTDEEAANATKGKK